MLKYLWALLMFVLPAGLKRHVGRTFLGWDIDKTAYLGRSLLIGVRNLSMGPGASIGPFNLIRDLDELRLAEGASISSRNWIVGMSAAYDSYFPVSKNRRPSLLLGKHAMITMAHDFDCADLIEIGDYSAIAGFRCTILTHNLDLVRDRFITAPVRIGRHAAVMTGTTILSGMSVPDRSIVSAGSVVNTRLKDELTFYGGNPAEPLRSLPETLGFFRRGEGGPETLGPLR